MFARSHLLISIQNRNCPWFAGLCSTMTMSRRESLMVEWRKSQIVFLWRKQLSKEYFKSIEMSWKRWNLSEFGAQIEEGLWRKEYAIRWNEGEHNRLAFHDGGAVANRPLHRAVSEWIRDDHFSVSNGALLERNWCFSKGTVKTEWQVHLLWRMSQWIQWHIMTWWLVKMVFSRLSRGLHPIWRALGSSSNTMEQSPTMEEAT